MTAKAIAAASVPATTQAGKGVIAIPPTANVEAIKRSATDETTSQKLGREDHSTASMWRATRQTGCYQQRGHVRAGHRATAITTDKPRICRRDEPVLHLAPEGHQKWPRPGQNGRRLNLELFFYFKVVGAQGLEPWTR